MFVSSVVTKAFDHSRLITSNFVVVQIHFDSEGDSLGCFEEKAERLSKYDCVFRPSNSEFRTKLWHFLDPALELEGTQRVGESTKRGIWSAQQNQSINSIQPTFSQK